MKAKILFVDDEKPLRDTLARWFARDYECLTAPDGESALKLIEANEDLALVVTDERMPQMSGTELVRAAKKLRPELSVIMLTAYGSLELAVEAMRNGGADDFYQKPITDLKSFEPVVAKAVEKSTLKREVATLRREVADLKAESGAELENFTGRSPAMQKIYRLIRKLAPTTANVLVEGPSGTGKELVARALHNLSPRSKGPFIAVECAAFSAELLQAELFGYMPGTFTGGLKDGKKGCFEQADGGTIFLDEIGEIDMPTQINLLRVLETKSVRRMGGSEEKKVDFRLIAATNRDLQKLVSEGKFREDLFYRLNVVDLHMPALKDRPGDIGLLVARFLKEFAAQYGTGAMGINSDALKLLEDYAWPGNVRQLRNVIEKMVVLASGNKLGIDDLPVEITRGIAPGKSAIISTEQTLAATEKQQILAALAANGNNKSKAADALGISRRTLHRKLKEWNA